MLRCSLNLLNSNVSIVLKELRQLGLRIVPAFFMARIIYACQALTTLRQESIKHAAHADLTTKIPEDL